MKKTTNILGIILLIIVLFTLLTLAAYSTNAQDSSVGTPAPDAQLTLQKSLVAGGGSATQQAQFSLQATAGQAVAGRLSTGGQFKVYSGFWTPEELMPDAAGVSISGRVSTDTGAGLKNIIVTLTDANGVVRTAVSGTFGFYQFDNVVSGQQYVVRVVSKRYKFTSQVLSVSDNVANLDFAGQI